MKQLAVTPEKPRVAKRPAVRIADRATQKKAALRHQKAVVVPCLFPNNETATWLLGHGLREVRTSHRSAEERDFREFVTPAPRLRIWVDKFARLISMRPAGKWYHDSTALPIPAMEYALANGLASAKHQSAFLALAEPAQ